MQKHNKTYYRHTPLEELISRYYRKPEEGETSVELSNSMMQALSTKNKKLICL